MLGNTEGAIKNEQCRETGNIGYTRRKKKHKKNTTQYVLDTNMCKQTQSTDHLSFSQKQVQRSGSVKTGLTI